VALGYAILEDWTDERRRAGIRPSCAFGWPELPADSKPGSPGTGSQVRRSPGAEQRNCPAGHPFDQRPHPGRARQDGRSRAAFRPDSGFIGSGSVSSSPQRCLRREGDRGLPRRRATPTLTSRPGTSLYQLRPRWFTRHPRGIKWSRPSPPRVPWPHSAVPTPDQFSRAAECAVRRCSFEWR
jgi:hypothetical protein